jgi:hypothetical protein
MTVQEYTLYEKWIEVHEKYPTVETNSFFDDKPALLILQQEAFIKQLKIIFGFQNHQMILII